MIFYKEINNTDVNYKIIFTEILFLRLQLFWFSVTLLILQQLRTSLKSLEDFHLYNCKAQNGIEKNERICLDCEFKCFLEYIRQDSLVREMLLPLATMVLKTKWWPSDGSNATSPPSVETLISLHCRDTAQAP